MLSLGGNALSGQLFKQSSHQRRGRAIEKHGTRGFPSQLGNPAWELVCELAGASQDADRLAIVDQVREFVQGSPASRKNDPGIDMDGRDDVAMLEPGAPLARRRELA